MLSINYVAGNNIKLKSIIKCMSIMNCLLLVFGILLDISGGECLRLVQKSSTVIGTK